jgi:hypothetical protein
MKSKISIIVGSVLALIVGLVLALTNTATEPVLAKGSDYTGQDFSVDNPVQLPGFAETP